MEKNLYRGVLCVIGASIIFGCMPTVNKYIMLSGITPLCLALYIQIIIGISALLTAKCSKTSIHVSTRELIQLILIGSIGMGATTYLLNLAVIYIPVGLATVLHFLYPTVVSVTMVVLFKQKFSVFRLLAILSSIIGMLMITNLNGGKGQFSFTGIILATLSSMTYAFYMIANEKGQCKHLPLIVRLIYSALGSSLLLGILLLWNETPVFPDSISIILLTICYCGVGSLISYYLITGGIKYIGATFASFINMLEPVTSVVVSALIFKESIMGKTIIGMGLILSAVLSVSIDSAIHHEQHGRTDDRSMRKRRATLK